MIYITCDKSPEIFSWAALRRRRRRLRRGGGGSHNSAKKAEGKDFHDHLRSLCVLQKFGLQPFCRRSTGGRCQAVSRKNLFPSPLCVNKPANFSDPQFIHWESQQVSPNFSDEVWKITPHQTNSICAFETCLKKTIYLSLNPHKDKHQMTRPNFPNCCMTNTLKDVQYCWPHHILKNKHSYTWTQQTETCRIFLYIQRLRIPKFGFIVLTKLFGSFESLTLNSLNGIAFGLGDDG